MKRIHRPELRPWISHETVTAQHFLDQCREANMSETVDQAKMNFSQFLKDCKVRVDPGMSCSSTASDCDPARHLSCPEESVLREGGLSHTGASDWLSDVDLESVKFLQGHPGARPNSVDYGKLVAAGSSVSANNSRVIRPSPEPGAIAIPKCVDAVIVIQVFRPAHSDSKKSAVIVDMEIEVLSCQTLQDIRLNICCASDLDKNISHTECIKSAYFFIGDTFYNDKRPGCSDYSSTIIRWSEEPGRGIGPFVSKDMATARISDLPFQLGYPYLYVHQGDCEHWVVFKDMRLLTSSDQSRGQFPKLTPVGRRHQVRCDICHTNVARWTIRENMRLPVDPSFFCDECHRSFNFDRENRQIGSFKIQSYVDKSILL